LRNFDFWQPWSDPALVQPQSKLKISAGQAHADIGDWLNVYLFVSGMGNVADNALQGRVWLTRAIFAAKTILATRYTSAPMPKSIGPSGKTAILDKYGCNFDGSWKVASTLPSPTLKQQIGFVVAEYMFTTPFNLANSRVTDVT